MDQFPAFVVGLTIRLEGQCVDDHDWTMELLVDEVLQGVPAYRHFSSCSWCDFSGFLHTRLSSCQNRQVDTRHRVKLFPTC
jgi:hypothetical protein